MTGSRILHTFFSPFAHESRALREGHTALEEHLCDEVLYVAYDDAGRPTSEVLAPGMRVERIPLVKVRFGSGILMRILQFLLWNLQVASRYRKVRVDLVHAHLLAGLPCAVIMSLVHRVPLLYDAHELETEREGWNRVTRACARAVERVSISFADRVIVVSPSISSWYAAQYKIEPPIVVRNVPKKKQAPECCDLLRTNLRIPPDHFIFLYLGLIAEARGVEELIDVFSGVCSDRHLVFMGCGPLVDHVRQSAVRFPNIHHHMPVPPDQVVGCAAAADIGLIFVEASSLSYRYMLPNKFFEYRLASLPVIVSDTLLELGSYIQEHGGGWVISFSVEELQRLVDRLTHEEIERVRSDVRGRPAPSWQEEKSIYTRILSELLKIRDGLSVVAD